MLHSVRFAIARVNTATGRRLGGYWSTSLSSLSVQLLAAELCSHLFEDISASTEDDVRMKGKTTPDYAEQSQVAFHSPLKCFSKLDYIIISILINGTVRLRGCSGSL